MRKSATKAKSPRSALHTYLDQRPACSRARAHARQASRWPKIRRRRALGTATSSPSLGGRSVRAFAITTVSVRLGFPAGNAGPVNGATEQQPDTKRVSHSINARTAFQIGRAHV